MADPTAPINDGVDGWIALCENGRLANGVQCTGSAHWGGQHIMCSDASHKAQYGITIPPGGVTIPASGLTFSTKPSYVESADHLYDAIRRSHQIETASRKVST